MCNKVYKTVSSFATVLLKEKELRKAVEHFWNSLAESERECFPDAGRFINSLSPAHGLALLHIGYEAVVALREREGSQVSNELLVELLESFQSDIREVDTVLSDLLKRVERLEKFQGDALCWAGQVSERLSALERVEVVE